MMDENAICAVNIVRGEMRYITVRERRIDESVRPSIGPTLMRAISGNPVPELALLCLAWGARHTIRAEYRRIVEREEGRA